MSMELDVYLKQEKLPLVTISKTFWILGVFKNMSAKHQRVVKITSVIHDPQAPAIGRLS